MEHLVQYALERFGRVDVLINSHQHKALGFAEAQAATFPVELWDAILNVNLKGTFLTCREEPSRLGSRHLGRSEMRMLVQGSRPVWSALGAGARLVSPLEMEKRKVFRRRMVARRSLPKGHRLRIEDVDFKRPGTGIAPDQLSYVIGRTLARALECDEEVEWTDLA